MRKIYDIPATNEEVKSSNKFAFALYFDNQLNFIPEKLFFTVSGYIWYKKKLPAEFSKSETKLREELEKQFEDKTFNSVLKDLLAQYKVDLKNCVYAFVENLEHDEVNLHSFFIEDLEKAKNITTNNMNRYFTDYSGQRINLDIQNGPALFQEILQPKYYPLGRFPSNPDHPLSLMQEVAVNLALNDENDIRSVNGPPGTGKTTLLKDIFADLITQQAEEICNLTDKTIKGSIPYFDNAKLGKLPDQISNKNIVVTSSNNSAVQNIVNELPQFKSIADEFIEKIEKVDYFKSVANSKLTEKWINKEDKKIRTTKRQPLEEKNWGTFSHEGGKSENINQLLLNIEFIVQYLNEDYQPNGRVYKEFSAMHKQVLHKREDTQKYYEKLKGLSDLKRAYEEGKKDYLKEKEWKKEILEKNNNDKSEQINSLNGKVESLNKKLAGYETSLEHTSLRQTEAKRDFDVILSQKPSLFWLQKILNKNKVNSYFEKLNRANEELKDITKQELALKRKRTEAEQSLDNHQRESDHIRNVLKQKSTEFNTWKKQKDDKLLNLKVQIEKVTQLKKESGIDELDLSKPYEELQKSNPWFTKEYRMMQSDLFIKALEVRKQFLFDNGKNLKAARDIWQRRAENITKVNGEEMVREAWQWLNFAIPVVSTTFASFGRMFKYLQEDSISNLFIDEAGQALPQASVGAIFRSEKVMAVGDPSQIKPVLTVDSNILNLLGQNYEVSEKYVSADASTQTLIDSTSQYGFQKDEDEWIGIPLWVHRRSNYPMFTISNEISYNGLMVQGNPIEETQGTSEWFDISGQAKDKYVKEQADFLISRISKQINEDPTLLDEIYVITPFKNVAYKLALDLDSIGFTKRDKNNKATNVGTVHTFQGKEAKIVYFVLGADSKKKGAAIWAVSEPNILNVAATRAKEAFYIIGDKNLYSTIGSKVANKAISIIEAYNEN
ncbi:AAA domain-containing protein [Marinilactibacillus psychrotolerans]|uniref:AAA domain-containing protein n=1 Tax=Marinilactibacillus psychrotolerans TaxID=191770 RepID=UPI00388701E3